MARSGLAAGLRYLALRWSSTTSFPAEPADLHFIVRLGQLTHQRTHNPLSALDAIVVHASQPDTFHAVGGFMYRRLSDRLR